MSEDNLIHQIEREEHRDALRYTTTTPCYAHTHRPDQVGGLTCIDCGDQIPGDEI